MTKQEILDEFNDINFVYNNSSKHETLSHMLDELLEEQEPVKAVADGGNSYICNNCGTVIGWDAWEPGGVEEVKDKFCPECGRPVKWDA